MRVAVTTGGDPFGTDLVDGLQGLGLTVAEVGPVSALRTATACRQALVDVADVADLADVADVADVAGPLSGVVHACIDPDAVRWAELDSVDAEAWDRRCEGVLRTTLWVLQAAYAALFEQGGAIVLVTPTVGLSGAAGLVPYAAAVEGQRAMAKSAARRWGARGIRVNCVAPPIELLRDETGTVGGLADPALGRQLDVGQDVAPVVFALLDRVMASVTGTTVVVDGGVIMAP